MARVPNYYYNSPWIADAAKSLASAFAPPDPTKLREREIQDWQFEHEKTKAGYEAKDRENKKLASGYLGEMAAIFEKPPVNEKGEPDYDTMRVLAAGLSKKILDVGGPEYADEIERVGGPLIPSFIAKEKLREEGERARWERFNAGNTFKAGEGVKDREFEFEKQRREHAFRLEYLNEQAIHNIEAINARNKAEGKSNAITLTPAMGKAIMSGIYQRINSTGMKMDDAGIYKLFDKVADDTSRVTRNYATSLSRVWDSSFPGGVYKRKRGFLDFGSGDDEYLSPVDGALPAFGDEEAAAPSAADPTTVPPADGSRNLADPVTPSTGNNFFDRVKNEAAMEEAARVQAAKDNDNFGKTPAPAAKTPSAGKSSGAPPATLFKEGVPKWVKNKRTGVTEQWVLKNGKVTKVK